MNKNELSYLVTMLLLKRMLRESLLCKEDYETIDAQMKQKYDPKMGSLFTAIQDGRPTVS